MGRASRGEFLTTADYALGWGDNRAALVVAATVVDSEEDAMQRAAGLVDEMRRDGAASAMRSESPTLETAAVLQM